MKLHDHHRDATDEAFDSFLNSAVAEYVEKQDASAIFKIKDQEPWLFVAVQ